MTIYVDSLNAWGWRYGDSCHMMSDVSDEELHLFAEQLGLRRGYFQGDHYDLTTKKRELAVRNGAVECEGTYMVGLRKARRLRGAV